MFRTPIVGVALALGFAASSAVAQETVATTKAQCESLWNEALAGSPAPLPMEKAQPYVTDFKKADKNGDKKLSQVEWLDSCGDRLIRSSASTGAASGSTGASGSTSDRTPGESSTPDRPTPAKPY